MKDLFIFGAGVMGRVVADLVAWQFGDRYRVAGFFDDGRKVGDEVGSHGRVLGRIEDAPDWVTGDAEVFLALGSRNRGKALALLAELRGKGAAIASLVSPDARIAPSAQLGENAMVMPGAYLGCESAAGDLFFAYGNAVVEHHVKIGHGVLLAPGSVLNSAVEVGHGALLGAGVVVGNSVSIGAGSLIGTGSVVHSAVPAGIVVVGNPATPLRRVKTGDEVVTPDELARLYPPA